MVLPVAGSWRWRPALTTNIHKTQTLGMSEAPALKQPVDTKCTLLPAHDSEPSGRKRFVYFQHGSATVGIPVCRRSHGEACAHLAGGQDVQEETVVPASLPLGGSP